MHDPAVIERFYDRCSHLMRELLDALATAPDTRRSFPEVEDAIGWPRRRIASVLGGVWRLRTTEFAGRRPYRLMGEDFSASGRWEIWCDAIQARALTTARDDWFDLAGPQQSAVLVMVIATIGENEVGFLAWPARLASNRPGV
jgi:hypothetical protein